MDELHYQIDLLSAMNQKLGSSEKMYRFVCDTSDNAFLYYSFEEDKITIFGNWKNFFEFEVESMKDIGKIYESVQEKYIIPLREILFIEKDTIEKASVECCLLNGKKWFECEAIISYNEFRKPQEKIIRFKDITKFKNQNDELAYLAYYDNLTGLYNRNYFVRLLAEWLRNAEDDKSVVAVMFIDIDDFRKINDGMGLIIGDELVQIFGQYLGEFRCEKVMISHFNSDLFCIGIYDPCGTRSIEHIYKTIQNRLESSFLLSNRQELNITICAGVAEFPEASKTALELINCAEIVMFKAKVAGKNAIQYFDAPIMNDFLRNLAIETKLKEAIYSKQFMLYYQPQYDVISGKLRGVEALIRWKDNNGKMISPSDFIPIAERNGSIVSIGNWVIEEAISTYALWKRKFNCKMIMSINISAIQYKRPDFVSSLTGVLSKYNVNFNEIELEITESILIDDFKEVIDKLYALRNYGLRISLDDFGTGFSSLAYLKGLPIDTLKIDKSFIDTVITDDSTRIITESIVTMVKKLGFETVAEGVETKEQFDYLKQIKCDNIQGYYLGHPMCCDDMETLLIKKM